MPPRDPAAWMAAYRATSNGAAACKASNLRYYEGDKYQKKQRRNQLKRYGLTIEGFERLYWAQDGLCAICRLPEKANRKNLAVDHCHKTGKIRGLLCLSCNNALERLESNPSWHELACAYLKEHQ